MTNNHTPPVDYSPALSDFAQAEVSTAETVKNKAKEMTAAAAEQLSKVTTNEKIAGAAALGVIVGAAAAAIGSAMLNSDAPAKKTTKAAKKPAT